MAGKELDETERMLCSHPCLPQRLNPSSTSELLSSPDQLMPATEERAASMSLKTVAPLGRLDGRQVRASSNAQSDCFVGRPSLMPNPCGRKNSGLIHRCVPPCVNELEETKRFVLSEMIVNRPKSASRARWVSSMRILAFTLHVKDIQGLNA